MVTDATRPMIEITDLRKSYGTLDVLKGVSLNASEGEVVTLIGSSGSGKSTLLRCVNLLELPSAGSIRVKGELIDLVPGKNQQLVPKSKRQVELLRLRVGMVFQSFNLWPHLTVLENLLEAPVHVLKQSRAEATGLAEAMLEKVGIADKRHEYPAMLSGGQQQRVAIARALAMQPEVMLFDEPTSALDPEMVGEVLKVIQKLAEEGRTMMIVTHEMKFAQEVSSKVAFLHQGLIEELGSPQEVLVNPRSARCRQFVSQT